MPVPFTFNVVGLTSVTVEPHRAHAVRGRDVVLPVRELSDLSDCRRRATRRATRDDRCLSLGTGTLPTSGVPFSG